MRPVPNRQPSAALRLLALAAGGLLGAEALRQSQAKPHQAKSRKHGNALDAEDDAASTTAPPVDPRQLCPSVSYIRIQKTGSSTFGELIMPAMCVEHNQTSHSFTHMEYLKAKHRSRHCMVTILRDPVERFLSEFTFVRSASDIDAFSVEQDQWDVDLDDVSFIKEIRAMKNSREALHRYLHWPRNPSRNRQTLYLLGFKRVACSELRCCGKECTDTTKNWTAGVPALQYDWDKDHDKLLARAKKHLQSLRAFGLTDCFRDSMRVIGEAFGWNGTAMDQIASVVHTRQSIKWDVMNDYYKTAGAEPLSLLSGGHAERFARESARGAQLLRQWQGVDAGSVLWRSFIHEDVAEEIRKVNRLDEELVAYARQLLYERHGIRCGGRPDAGARGQSGVSLGRSTVA